MAERGGRLARSKHAAVAGAREASRFAAHVSARVGSPDEVASKLNASLTKVRTTHLVLGMHLPGIAPERSRSSMELFAREVAPQLKPPSGA